MSPPGDIAVDEHRGQEPLPGRCAAGPASGTVEPMNTAAHSSPPAPPRRPLPWLLIIGLASLSLLWPLTSQWQLGQGLPRAALILSLTAVVWIGVVGVGRIPHPVLTLTLAGVLHGAIGMVVGWVIPGDGPGGSLSALWLMLPAVATSAGTGALLGLVALAVQALIGPRSGVPAARAGES